MRNRILTATATMLLLFPLLSWAQVQWGQEYDRQLKTRKTLSAFGSDQFGESVNLYDGTVSFSATDIEVPGNGGLPMGVSRTFSIGNPKNAASDGLFGNWNMALPYVGIVSDGGAPLGQVPNPNFLWPAGNSQARCSSSSAMTPELGGTSGGGNLFTLNPQTSSKLVRPTMSGMRWVTKGFWYFSCVPNLASGHPGEGFVGVDPSGTKYTFNWMVNHFYPGSSLPGMGMNQIQVHRADVRLYPTRVEDRFGNWVNYQWQGRRLLSVTSNDGRRVDFTYGSDDQILKATANGRSWTYSYNDYPASGGGGRLAAVTSPDGKRWSFGQDPGNYVHFEPKYEMRPGPGPGGGGLQLREYEILEKVARCSYDHYLSALAHPFEVTHPSGARAMFMFKTMRHGRTGVPAKCQRGWDNGGDGGVLDAQNSQNMYPAFKVVMSLQSKRVEGPGLAAQTWQYGYTNLQACVAEECSNQGTPTRKQVTVTSPDGDQTMSTFGKQFGENEGQLLSVQTVRGGVVASRTDYGYVSNSQAAQMPFPDLIGQSTAEFPDTWSEAAIRPMSETIKVQDGVTFWKATNSFDAFARPVSVTRENTKGYKKTDVTEYYDNLSYWVIGQPARQYNAETGMVEVRTDYNDKALPWRVYRFEKLQSTTIYNADSTVASVIDGRNNAMVLSDWKRGIPQSIRYPATPESPGGAVESAVIDDNGWLVSHTEENGYTTSYNYDAMGRLTRIKYPVGDASTYHDTTFALNQLTASDWLPPGVAVGQWYRTEATGSARKFIYLDAMWRPVLEHTYDDSNVAGTLSATRTQYDSDGQVVFKSYPSSQSGAGASGVRSYYDALGRSVRQEQDSEHNALVTTTEYLADLQVRVTNPRGYQTTTRYMAWDEPSYELAVWSSQPEGKVIEVTRHPQFGWPLQLTQRSADGSVRQDRKYVYDGAAKLCKTIEPETGATVMGYDEAGNLVWSATGHHDLTSTATCNHAEGYGWGRRVDRSYDALNRLTALSFPDGRGNQTWRHTPDGLPASITTYNDSANGAPVVNAYSYNRRRMLAGESITQPGGYSWGIGYNYDAYGSLSTQTYPTGLIVNYAPNALGQPTRADSYATGVQYYPNGAIKQFTYGNGIVHTMSQNARQLPARVINSGNALDHTYGYDVNGNVEHIYDNVVGTPTLQHRYMQYDGLDRLKAVGSQMFGGDLWHRLSYDALDNLKSWKLAGVKDHANYTYDAQNRLTNIKNTAGATVTGLDYDVQGNLANKNGQLYAFDFGNRLRSVPSKETYRYDGQGHRVQTNRADGTQTLWQYSQAGQMLFSHDGPAAQKTHENVYLGSSLVATIDHDWPSNAITAIKYQHTDALGSPVAVTNTTGVVIERTNYEPYGAAINKTVNGIGYTGHVMDAATGLTYMQQRYYDQELGRFLSVDPVTADANTGEMFNRYKYANNNPYRFTDPDGRQERDLIDMSVDTVKAGWDGYKEGWAISSGYNDVQSRALRKSAGYKGAEALAAKKGGAKVKLITKLARTGMIAGELWAQHVAGLTMANKRMGKQAVENVLELTAPQGEPQGETAPQGGASAPKPPPAATKPVTAVQRAMEAPQGKYRERKEK